MSAATAALNPLTPDLAPLALALNNAHASELGWLEPPAFAALLGQAFYAAAFGQVDAFVLALQESATYGSPNFRWFRDRYPRFAYVDRVVVAASARGRGIARQLYAGVFDRALREGHTLVACEVNIDPPNPGSDAFHAKLGFEEVGRAAIHGGARTVRYLTRRL